jgi:hypothetical protein
VIYAFDFAFKTGCAIKLESKDIVFVAFQLKKTQLPKSLSCIEFGDAAITRRLSLAEYYYTQPCLNLLFQVVPLLMCVLEGSRLAGSWSGWKTKIEGIMAGLP